MSQEEAVERIAVNQTRWVKQCCPTEGQDICLMHGAVLHLQRKPLLFKNNYY